MIFTCTLCGLDSNHNLFMTSTYEQVVLKLGTGKKETRNGNEEIERYTACNVSCLHSFYTHVTPRAHKQSHVDSAHQRLCYHAA